MQHTLLTAGNLKIVTTGLLLRVALRRQLSRLQWLALLLLMAGAATSQINTDCSKGTVQSVLNAPVMVSVQCSAACTWGIRFWVLAEPAHLLAAAA